MIPIPALGILGAAAISAIGGAFMNRRAEKVAQRNAEQQRQWQQHLIFLKQVSESFLTFFIIITKKG